MYMTDAKMIIRHCNDAMLSFLRLTRPALIGQSVDDLVNVVAELLVEGEAFRERQSAMIARARRGVATR